MLIITEQFEDLVIDVDHENPNNYDYGWRLDQGSMITGRTLKLNLLPREIKEGWWLYNFKVNYYLLYEINH